MGFYYLHEKSSGLSGIGPGHTLSMAFFCRQGQSQYKSVDFYTGFPYNHICHKYYSLHFGQALFHIQRQKAVAIIISADCAYWFPDSASWASHREYIRIQKTRAFCVSGTDDTSSFTGEAFAPF